MQSILAVSSVQQLDRCLPHVLALARGDADGSQDEQLRVAIWVLAEGKSSLQAFAGKRAKEIEEQDAAIAFEVESIAAHESTLLLKMAEWRHADWLVLPYADEQQDLFIRLFEQSPCRTILLDPGSEAVAVPTRFVTGVEDAFSSVNYVRSCCFAETLHSSLGNLEFLLSGEKAKRRQRLIDAVDNHQLEPSDLIVTAVERDTSASDDYLIARQLLDLELPASVMIVRHRMSIVEHAWSRIEKQITRYVRPLERDARVELSNKLELNSVLQFDFVALMCAATCLAAFGLVQNSAAVIIGAMLVAPLMSPIMGAGLAISQGNFPLLKRAASTVFVGFLCALLTSACFGLLVRFLQGTEITSEMWARSSPSLLDFLVGFVGGLAAAYARSRPHLSDALAGAAIAAALVPPIATAGLQLAFLPIDSPPAGHHAVFGPLLLFLANVLTITIATWIVLWLSGVHGDHQFGNRQRWANRAIVLVIALTILAAIVIVETR